LPSGIRLIRLRSCVSANALTAQASNTTRTASYSQARGSRSREVNRDPSSMRATAIDEDHLVRRNGNKGRRKECPQKIRIGMIQQNFSKAFMMPALDSKRSQLHERVEENWSTAIISCGPHVSPAPHHQLTSILTLEDTSSRMVTTLQPCTPCVPSPRREHGSTRK